MAAAASSSDVTGQNGTSHQPPPPPQPSSQASPCWPQHFQPQDLLCTAPPPSSVDFQLSETSSPHFAPPVLTIVDRGDAQVKPSEKAMKCVMNTQDKTKEVVAEEATTSRPPPAEKADLHHALSLVPTLPSTVSPPPLPSAELTGQDHNSPKNVMAAEAIKVELVIERKRRKKKQPQQNLRGLLQLPSTNICPTPQTPFSPGIVVV